MVFLIAGRLTDCNTINGSTTSRLIAEAGAIPLLIKVLREVTVIIRTPNQL